MNKVLAGLEPASVFAYFEAICAIPHGSRDTKRISDYCVEFAKAHSLRHVQDDSNNVIIWKDGTAGYEDHAPVVIQGHLDMVCEKEADCDLDFGTDGLRLRRNGDWIDADGTTLGGDDGIAVAYALALLDSETISHPPLEVVLTVDEEIGMLGAEAIDLSGVRGRKLLNIDSEAEGILTVSCAGGATSTVSLPLNRISAEGTAVTLEICDLQGGHSGVEIHKNRCNANKLMGELLTLLRQTAAYSLITVNGGAKDNAIPRSCKAVLLTADAAALEASVNEAAKVWLPTVQAIEPEAKLTLNAGESGTYEVLSNTDSLVDLICALPNGVQAWSKEIPGLVQTSLNMGILATREDDAIMTFSVRSSVNVEKQDLIAKVRSTGEAFGAVYTQMGEYPAWEYNKESTLRPVMVEVFEKLYGRTPVVEAIHAGLECGILADKLPGLDCVSFGPDMRDIHTSREMLSISSVARTWDYLCAVLAEL